MGVRSGWLFNVRRGFAKVVAVLILFGFFAGWITAIGAVIELSNLAAARTWPSRKAVLTHSYVRHIKTPPRPYWRAEIAGTYVDDGSRFGVRRVRFGMWNTPLGRRGAEAHVAKYPVNTPVDVYYSPSDPKRVTFEPGVSATSTWVALVVGVGFGLLPAALYLYGRVTGWRPPDESV